MNGWSPIGSHRVKQFLSLGFLLRVFLFGTPIVLLFVIITKATRTHPIVFTSLPPPPVVVPYAPEARTSIIGSLHLESAETNRPEIATAITKITKLEDDLSKLETKIYSENPSLWTYEHYRTVIDAWYWKRPSSALDNYRNVSDPEKAHRREKSFSDILNLSYLVLLKEQAGLPAFGPLIHDTMEACLQRSPNFMNFSDSDHLAEAVTGVRLPRIRNVSSKSYEQWLTEIKLRYPMYVDAIDRIVKKNKIPPDVFADIKDYAVRQLFTGLALEYYIPMHTPKELIQMRQALDREVRQLTQKNQNHKGTCEKHSKRVSPTLVLSTLG